MIACFFFEKKLGWKQLKESYYNEDYIIGINEKFYFDNTFPICFELAFYNWIIAENQLVGVNFQFHSPYEELILDFLANDQYKSNLLLDEQGINIFFRSTNKALDTWIDYDECFVELFLLRSKEGNIAITFEIPNDFEYKIPAN